MLNIGEAEATIIRAMVFISLADFRRTGGSKVLGFCHDGSREELCLNRDTNSSKQHSVMVLEFFYATVGNVLPRFLVCL